MKRLIITLLLCMTLLLGTALTAMAAQKQVVRYWSRKSGPDHTVTAEMVAYFNKTHPNIQVKAQFMTWGGAYYGKVRASILGGNPPELFDVAAYAPPMFRNNVESFTKEELAQMGINVSDYVQSAWDVVKYKGRYYGTVNSILPLGLFYNKEMFRKAGLNPNKPPRNLKEFIEYGKKLTKDTNGDGKIDQWGFMFNNSMNSTPWEWESILVQSGGSLLNKEMTRATFNNKLGIDALNLCLDLSRKYKIAPLTLSDSWMAFAAKKVAMIVSGPWMISGFRNKVDLGTAPLPQLGSKRPAAWSSIDAYFFPKGKRKNTKRWNATMTYAKWVLGPEGQKFYTRMHIPSRLDVLNSPQEKALPYMSAFAKEVADGAIYYATPQKDMQEIYGILWSNLQGAFAGKMTAQQALAKAESGINRVLAR